MDSIRRDVETTGSACECYINTTEIKKGSWQDDPGECLRNCKAQFLRTVVKGWQDNKGWVEGCGSLSRGVPVQEFWSLYWCDSVFCGVGINQTGGLGQDPTVDLIINTCQNIGFYSILDPGPPPPNFRCSTEADPPKVCSATTIETPPQATQGRQPNPEPPMPTNTASRTAMTTQTKPSPAVVTSQPTSATPTTTQSSAPPPAASTTSGSSLTGQGKAAIAVCSVLALILLIAFALVCLRRRKRRKASFHRALRSRRGLLPDGAPAGSPTPLISAASSAIGTRTVLTPPLRLRDRKFLPSILRPGSRSPSPPLTPLTPAYSPQPSASAGAGGVFPPSPICSPTTNKLIPRHERGGTPAHATTATTSSTPRTFTGYPPPPPTPLHPPPSFATATATAPAPPPPHTETTDLPPSPNFFALPIPIPGSPCSSTWPPPYSPPAAPPPHGLSLTDNNNNKHNRASGAGSASSSCYTAGTVSSGTAGTAHSSLRGGKQQHQEVPIVMPFYMGVGGGGGGGGASGGGDRGETRDRERGMDRGRDRAEVGQAVTGSPLPNRPPRPHEGMLEVPGLVTPALGYGVGGGGGGGGGGGVREGGYGGGQERGYDYSHGHRDDCGYVYDDGDVKGGIAEGGSVGSVSTPPPPPPLSPPPTRALPKTPPASVSTPPPLMLPARGSARGSPAPGSVSPPPGSLGRTRGDGKSSHQGLLGLRGPGPTSAAGTETGSPYCYEHGRLAGYSPAAEQTPDEAGGRSQQQRDARGSWGSWSGAGTVVGSVSYHASSASNVNFMAGTVTPAGAREGNSSGARGQHVSPRTSVSSDVTATGDTMVSAVSRMSSTRDDSVGRGI